MNYPHPYDTCTKNHCHQLGCPDFRKNPTIETAGRLVAITEGRKTE